MFATSPGSWNSGIEYGSEDYLALRKLARQSEEDFKKSFTTGDGVVLPGDTGGRATRVQFLHNVLEKTSFDQEDAMAMKLIPKEKVYSNTFEWSQFNQYGGPGDGFVPETGASTSQSSALFFGVNLTDDTFTRLVKQIRYMAAIRYVSLVSTLVKNLEDPEKVSEEGATLEIIGKANSAIYFGDSRTSSYQFDGIARQLRDWLNAASYGTNFPGFPNDQSILFDAGGQPVDKYMLEDICVNNKVKFGKGSLLMQSPYAWGDSQKLLFPEARLQDGTADQYFGWEKRKFRGPYGTVRLQDDPLLRPNRPLAVEGNGVTGKPRVAATEDSGALDWSATPFSAGAATTPGTAYFWQNVNLNTDSAAIGGSSATTPALPAGDGNQGNRLGVQTVYYAASIVYQGKEGQAWVNGASAASTVSSASSITTSGTNSVVKLTFDLTQIPNLSSLVRSTVKIRVYRALAATKNDLTEFDFLFEVGLPTSGNTAVAVDNGMNIPGSDTSFFITEKKNNTKGWFLAQLLPLMKRDNLPEQVLGIPIAMLAFIAPILLSPRHHVEIRNVGRAN